MSEYNEGQAIEAAKWEAAIDAGNNRVNGGAYVSNPYYRHEHDSRSAQASATQSVFVPNLFPEQRGTAVTSTSSASSYGSRGGDTSGDSGAIWLGIGGFILAILMMPVILWGVGVAASRVQPWAQGVLEIGHATGLFGAPALLLGALFVAALIAQWLIALAVSVDADDPFVALLVVALTLFAATEAMKAALAFAHAPDFGCRAAFAWIPQTCTADLWSFAKGIVAWAGLGTLTGLAAWAMTVVTAIVYLGLGMIAQLAVLSPVLAFHIARD